MFLFLGHALLTDVDTKEELIALWYKLRWAL